MLVLLPCPLITALAVVIVRELLRLVQRQRDSMSLDLPYLVDHNYRIIG